ncbi:MAG: VCBS repeat-containing protein [Acidobacteria bacterium]|nr:VCBS repeat-containing protein [Acidobacteriota bacterium]
MMHSPKKPRSWYFTIGLWAIALFGWVSPPALAQSGWAREYPPEGETVPDPMDDLGSLEPADGKWLKDEEGREYFVKKLRKQKRAYQWIDAEQTKIRYKKWYTFTVVKTDPEYLYLKIYRPAPVEDLAAARAEAAAADEAHAAAIAETYRPQVGQSDRLTFAPFDRGLPKRGMWRNGLDVADINGDGNLDIIHGPARKGALIPRIFLGNGAGEWHQWSEARYPKAPYDYGDAAAADFNGDGLMDLAFGFHLRGVLVLIQEAPGRFRSWSEGLDLQIPGEGDDASGFSTRELEIADWNSDGRPDIIALGEGPRPAGSLDGKKRGILTSMAYGGLVYLNHGDGTWERLDKGLVHQGVFGDSLALGDFDGNGRLDFLTSSNVLDRRDLLNLGTPGSSEWSREELDLFRPTALVQAVAAGDFNSDGRTDMALAFASWEMKIWRTGLDVILSGEKGTWTRTTLSAEEGRRSLWAMDEGDVDGDGKLDLVASTGDGEVWIFLGNGAGGFDRESSPEIASPRGCRGYDVLLVDIDKDGRDEIVASFAGEGSALPLPEFPVACRSGGEIAIWRPEPKKTP